MAGSAGAAAASTLHFLGTGNFLAPGRYWNSFVLDGTVLVEPSPTSLPNLRRCGLDVRSLDVVVISHFHADHTFGWPFLLLEIVQRRDRQRPLYVVGPPGLAAFLEEMLLVGGVPNIRDASAIVDLRFVEVDVDGTWQEAGALRFRAVEVVHVDHLRCFGYLFARGERTIGYSGDTKPCDGLTELASSSDVLVLECNGAHPPSLPPVPVTHMDVDSVRALRSRHPSLPLVLTHLGDGVDAEIAAAGLDPVIVPDDFDRIEV